MPRLISIVLGLAVALGGCASYTARTVPIPRAGVMPAWRVDDLVAIGADAYGDTSRQKEAFDEDLAGEGVLPVQILVQNTSTRTLVVRKPDMTLTLPSGVQVTSVGPSAVASRFDSAGSVIGPAIAFGIVGLLVASNAADNARTARLADYRAKELPDATLNPGDSVHGFVYFMPPATAGPFASARLTVRVVDPAALTSAVVELSLDRFAFKGSPDRLGAPAPPTPTAANSAVAPDARTLIGTWRGTITLPFVRMGQYAEADRRRPAELTISEQGGALTWSMTATGSAARALVASGSAVLDAGVLILSGVFDRDAGALAGTAIQYRLIVAEGRLDGSGIGADNQTQALSLTR